MVKLLNNRKTLWRVRLFSHLVLAAGDALAVNLSFVLAFWLRFHVEFGVGMGLIKEVGAPPLEIYWRVLGFLNCIAFAIFFSSGLYDTRRLHNPLEVNERIIRVVTSIAILLVVLTYFLREEFLIVGGFDFSRAVVLWFWILAMVLMMLWRWVDRQMVRWFKAKGYGKRNVALIGANKMTSVLAKKFAEHPGFGIRVSGFIADAGSKGKFKGIPYLGEASELSAILQKHSLDEVIVLDHAIEHYDLLEIVNTCEQTRTVVTMIPSVYDLIIDYGQIFEVDGVPMFWIHEKDPSRTSLFIKRVFDFVLSAVLLLLSAPIFAAMAIAIRRDGPGPILFSQKRVGEDGKEFMMYKFRSMTIDAEDQMDALVEEAGGDEPVFKHKNDPRITRSGRWLRRSSLDELPQLWNVFKGDMSFVGPRPEEMRFVRDYDVWQRRRLKIKPGITGLQQVECRGVKSLAERVRYDVYYVRKRSLLMDIWILLRTIPVVFTGKGAS